MKKLLISLLVVFTLAASMLVPAFAAKGVDIYLDELSMSSYIFHQGTIHPNAPWIGVRFEHPDQKPWYYDASQGTNVAIDSPHTIGAHEPWEGDAAHDPVAHTDLTWDISAFAANNSLPFSAKVCKAGGPNNNAEYSVLIDGEQKWTSGVVNHENGLISIELTIPKGAKTLTFRADRGADNTWGNGEFHLVDAKITLPAGSKVTRMDKQTFSYHGNASGTKLPEESYYIGTQYESSDPAHFFNPQYGFANKFTTKNVISGHQCGDNDGNAYVEWDISNLGAGYFTVAVCNNATNAYQFDGQFSILVDGEKKAESAVMKGSDGLWRGTVQIPADAQKLTVIVNWGTDNITCGAFTVADPIFVEDPPAPDPVNPDDPSPTTSDALVSAAVAVAFAAAAVVVFSRKKRV